MNPQVTAYINNAGNHQDILEAARKIIQQVVPDVIEEYKWSRLVFRASQDFAYLKTSKAYVTLGFFNFQKLNDPNKLLSGTGKEMRHIKLTTLNDMKMLPLTVWLKEASKN